MLSPPDSDEEVHQLHDLGPALAVEAVQPYQDVAGARPLARYWISASGMATHYIAEDDLELYALNRLVEPDIAPVGPALAVPPVFAAQRGPTLDSAIRNGE
jgi:hypothetical protein